MKSRIGILLIIFVTIFSCDDKKDDETTELIKAVKYLEVNGNSQTNVREISGALSPQQSSELSFRVSGQISDIFVKKGQKVKTGEILAKLKTTEYDSNLESAKANLQSAMASVNKQDKNFTRQEMLFEKKLISNADYEKAELLYQDANSELIIATENLEKAKLNIKYTSLTAPFNSVIADLYVEAFAEIKQGQKILKTNSSDLFQVEILVSETFINNVNISDEVTIDIPATKSRYKGIVSEIGAQSEQGNAYPVTIRLKKATPDLLSGMTALTYLSYKASDNEVYLIPSSAIDFRFEGKNAGEATIYLFIEDTNKPGYGTIKQQTITGNDIRTNMIEVISGLKDGDKVVTAGVSYLSDGQKVKKWEE
jgi:multidrug efflux system membrane fusion protein